MDMRLSFTKILTMSAATLALTLTTGLATAADYPSKPITMWLGFRPGGAVDTTGRIVAKKLEEILGQPVVPVTKSGGGGTVMATQLINAAPDGYTIGMGASAAYTLTPLLNKKLTYKIEDFQHLATLSSPSDAIVVKKDSPWNSLKDVAADAKKNKKEISFATQVAASRLMMMVIGEKDGVTFKMVPVRGGAAGIQQVLGGHVDMTWSGSGWTKQVAAGTMKPLATMSPERMKGYPDIPTLIELGYNFTFTDTFMLSAPKGIPAEATKVLSDALKKAMSDPEVAKSLYDKFRLNIAYRNAEDTLKFLNKQRADVEPLVAKMNK
jgi:tripartite-type tricarboxylate transporter receptor subunit TctC